MRLLQLVCSVACVLVVSVVLGGHVSALSLRIAPLSYETTLAKGETKKGFVDISNSDASAQTIRFEVQAFRQIDDEGSLQYYPNEQVAAGIRLDYNEAQLGPRETLRLAFAIDGRKLPEGDVFAVIFATTTPLGAFSAMQSVRVGTLLMIQNVTPSQHVASVSEISAPFLQIGEAVEAQLAVTNTANPSLSTGFFPEVKVDMKPYGATTAKGPLVLSGRTRTIDYRRPGDYVGFMLVEASAGGDSKSQVVFAVTGYWRWLMPIILAILTGIVLYVYNRRKKHRYHTHKKVTRIPVK